MIHSDEVKLTEVSRKLGDISARRTWRVAALVAVALIGGLVFNSTLPDRAVSKGGTPALGGPCGQKKATPSPQVYSQYDRKVLSLEPALYLPLGSSVPVEPDISGRGHSGFFDADGDRMHVAMLPNGDTASDFNGLGQYIQVPSAKSLSVTYSGCLTVEAWINPTVLQFPRDEGSGYVYVLGKGTADKQEYATRMYSLSNSEVPPRPNRISAYVFNRSGGKGSGAYCQGTVRPGVWIMLTFVVDSRASAEWPDGYISIYENGQLCRSKVSLSQFNVTLGSSNAPLRIGTRDFGSFFEGGIGKVAVYNSVLSSQEIFATYEVMDAGKR